MVALLLAFWLLFVPQESFAGSCEDLVENIGTYLPERVSRKVDFSYFICGTKTFHIAYLSDELQDLVFQFSQVKSHTFKPISARQYTFPVKKTASMRGRPIDLEKENQEVSLWLQYLAQKKPELLYNIILIPGYSDKNAKLDKPLHKVAKNRLDFGVHALKKLNAPLIVVSGGNVHPKNTPINEAKAMKNYLITKYQIPSFMIALEPYAQNSVTNLRNSARMLIKHGVKSYTIVTSATQSFYYNNDLKSGLALRALNMLGYIPGKFKRKNQFETHFTPTHEVFKRGPDPLDP